MSVDLHNVCGPVDECDTPAGHAGDTPPCFVRQSSTRLRLVPGALVPDGSAVSVSVAALDHGRPTGAAFVASDDFPGERLYICDPEMHTIDVLDQNYRPLFSFGGLGSGLGQLDTPTDIAVVRLETARPTGAMLDAAALLVVADRGNHRLQLFELDGAVIGEIGGHAGAWTPGRFPAATGAALFRLGDVPPLPFPSRLAWRDPYLDVACAGTVIRLDLAVVLLPDFAHWIAHASPAELRLAFLRFATDPHRLDIPESCLFEIAERLQPAWRRTAVQPPLLRQ